LKFRGVVTFAPVGGPFGLPSFRPLEAAAQMLLLQPSFSNDVIPLTDAEYNPKRRQYDAAAAVRKLGGRGRSEPFSFVLGLTEADIYVQGSNFVFGLADPQRATGIVSMARLRQNSNPRLLEERLMKEAAHEMGHLLGLKHCPEPTCIMSFANSTFDVDAKLPILCKDCLAQAGIQA